ncbi:MAG: DAK2 domain fusion protein YloV [Cellvibrionaceae bacterium]|jgi:DAK2 domain fusion protein YloV
MQTTANLFPAADEKMTICDGQQFKAMVNAGFYNLEKNQKIVNELNVFPVPDGDTGTNMLLTMRSAWKAIQASDETNIGEITKKFAKGALMGARGNSGVILSQIWRGIAAGLVSKETMSAADLAHSLHLAQETAYGGVMKPVEGTILTVVREGAEEAVDAAEKSDDVRFILRRTLTRCRQALERTPDQLPILKQAGVVDSGGKGLVYILEGMYEFALGEFNMDEPASNGDDNFEDAIAALTFQEMAIPDGGILENHYDVQFILLGKNLNVLEIRNTIDAMGDSTVVVGDDTTVKVHIHVDDPGEPLTYGISLGEVTDVVVENMQMQMDDIIASGQVHENAEGVKIGVAAMAKAVEIHEIAVRSGQIGVVTVASGSGLVDIMRGMGAAIVVEGGQTNNPSTEELFAAMEQVPTNKIILMPNNKNIILAAEQARDLSEKEVVVIPTRTVPQGIGAMLALNPDGDLKAISSEMLARSAEVVTAQITIGTRTVEINDVSVNEGDFIGLVDGELCASATDINVVLRNVLLQVDEMDEKEIVTLFYGSDVTGDDAAEIAEKIEAMYPDIEVEIQSGGQAHYHYILGIE